MGGGAVGCQEQRVTVRYVSRPVSLAIYIWQGKRSKLKLDSKF
jgi:hypothetical protein